MKIQQVRGPFPPGETNVFTKFFQKLLKVPKIELAALKTLKDIIPSINATDILYF